MFQSIQRIIPSRRSPQAGHKTVDKYELEKFVREMLPQVLGADLGGMVQIEIEMPQTIILKCQHPTWATAIRLKQGQLNQQLKPLHPKGTPFTIYVRVA